MSKLNILEVCQGYSKTQQFIKELLKLSNQLISQIVEFQ